MSLRIKQLATIDPLALPLPNGTAVTTRVGRAMGDRKVPEGAIGRVLATRGDTLDVLVVGVGVVSYARNELVPRKLGQTWYARRRLDAWQALSPCVVLEATVGSRAWGLAEAGSDTDVRGVFVLPFPWTTGLVDPPDTLVSADGSATYWEAGKAIRQALRADPNTLEMLFVPSARALEPMGAWLLEDRDAFVSVDVYGSFGRYALSQLQSMSRSLRLGKHRTLLLEWLREAPPPKLAEVARRLAAIGGLAGSEADRLLQAKEHVKQLYRSMFDQGLLAQNDYPSLVAYAGQGAPDLAEARDLRPKNAYNLVRLLAAAIHWLDTGAPQFAVQGALRDRLLAIKRGEVSLDETVAEAEALAPELERARSATRLPPSPDLARADLLLHRIREEAARRWLERAPGPFGAAMPEPPAPRDEGAATTPEPP